MFTNKNEFIKDFKRKMEEEYGRELGYAHPSEKYIVLGKMVREFASKHWRQTKQEVSGQKQKQMYYFSMEFLIGRLLTNNLMNLGIYNVVKEGLDELGIDINELEELESDAGLGNGGLGRLAACFLDSLASLSLPGNGNCIRYEYGLFRQKIVEGRQTEVPDQWLALGNVWEVRKPKHAVEVPFWGRVEVHRNEDGTMSFEHVDCEYVKAVPYDVPVVGRKTVQTNTLRLWSAEASENLPVNKDFRTYIQDVHEICQNVYPDDSTEHGRYLRLKQEYFFVASGLKALIKAHLRVYPSLDNFAEKIVIQLNDTHPVLCIPELMRILMDEYHYLWEDAWKITSSCMAYTNHTVMAEALERWPVDMVQSLLPRVYMIIEEIHNRFLIEVRDRFADSALQYQVSIIRDGQVHMAHLAVVGAFSVNGVAKIHTEILKNDVMAPFYKVFPEKFSNKTNGITHRRWLVYSNPQLRALLADTIGEDYIKDPLKLDELRKFAKDKEIQKRFMQVKRERKIILADYIKKNLDIEVSPDFIFDVQAKRLHAYKRQLLNVLHIIYLYQKMKADPGFRIVPRAYLFAAKAAPAYYFAKAVIKLINDVSVKVNSDPDTKDYLKVVFLPNYSVSLAEILMNAADVSEQISTAGKEASGTGNMKFMMNGALTLGTLDGANVEIDALVGRDNDVIFGYTVEELAALRESYDVWKIFGENKDLANAIDALVDGTFNENREEFKVIYDELMYKNDEYFVLGDFEAYRKAQSETQSRYQDSAKWAESMLINIACSGYFSSDRTVQEYVRDIWHIGTMKKRD